LLLVYAGAAGAIVVGISVARSAGVDELRVWFELAWGVAVLGWLFIFARIFRRP
jgi:hypothetical protein